jgi:hypothetical protein
MDLDLIHHPYVLVGLDVFCSALLVFLAVHLASRRFRSYLLRSGASLSAGSDPETELLGRGKREALEAEHAAGRSDVEKIARQARKLRRKGLSVEEISRKLETATSEIEMLLALNEIERTGKADKLHCALS